MRGGAMAMALALVVLVTGAASAQAPSPRWKAVVRIVPNPLPAGRCAQVSIEMQAPYGYRETHLSKGQVMDQKHFVFTCSDNSVFYWQNNDPTQGYVCVMAGAPSTKSTIRLSLPDGSSGQVEVTSLAAGESGT